MSKKPSKANSKANKVKTNQPTKDGFTETELEHIYAMTQTKGWQIIRDKYFPRREDYLLRIAVMTAQNHDATREAKGSITENTHTVHKIEEYGKIGKKIIDDE